jgi:hypothetical protein
MKLQYLGNGEWKVTDVSMKDADRILALAQSTTTQTRRKYQMWKECPSCHKLIKGNIGMGIHQGWHKRHNQI